MSKQIVVEKSARADILKKFNVSNKVLWEALNFKTKSHLANTLRAAALIRKGVVVDFRYGTAENPFNTYWAEAPQRMIQVFSDRVQFVLDMATSCAVIEVDGSEVREFQDVKLSTIAKIQNCAREIVDGLK